MLEQHKPTVLFLSHSPHQCSNEFRQNLFPRILVFFILDANSFYALVKIRQFVFFQPVRILTFVIIIQLNRAIALSVIAARSNEGPKNWGGFLTINSQAIGRVVKFTVGESPLRSQS